MKKILIPLAAIAVMAACKKTTVTPAPVNATLMAYINLHDTAVAFNRYAAFDLDSNGEKDVLFSTLLVGDPIAQQDKKQWYVSTSINTSLPVNDNESIPVLTDKDSISVKNFNGYTWYNAASVLLAEKIIGMTGSPFWQGDWKQAAHNFLPLQVVKNGAKYNGWVEVSFSTGDEKIILYRAALCKEKDKAVIAGK